MIPVYYDFHIHTALSPCANDDMTPNDIVGMALLNGLDMIAITDHNTFANVESVIKAASDHDLIVIPGMEVSTAEEAHVLCLFENLDIALGFEADLMTHYSTWSNRASIFGNQLLLDENDNVTGQMDRMLLAPTSLSFDDLYLLAEKHGGAFVPAHVDRDSFSVISNLGFLPPHLKINTVEVTQKGIWDDFIERNSDKFPNNDPKVICSSDSHQLWTLHEKTHFLPLPERSGKAAIEFLR